MSPAASTDFFANLSRPEHAPLLRGAHGTMRLELTDGKQTERWLVSVDEGKVSVSRANRRADCVFRADRKLFMRIVAGKENAFAAVLRGAVTVEGDPRLLVLFQRLLHGPRS